MTRKHMLCIGRVRNGGPVELDTGQTLEERLDKQIARNAEVLAMLADYEAMLAGKPVGYRLTAEQLAEIEDEEPGRAEAQPWLGW